MEETAKELEKYQQEMFKMFRTDGWKTLISDLSANAENINSVDAARDTNDLHFRKGQLNIINSILNLQYSVENMEIEDEAVV